MFVLLNNFMFSSLSFTMFMAEALDDFRVSDLLLTNSDVAFDFVLIHCFMFRTYIYYDECLK